jgi:hypothetical protein
VAKSATGSVYAIADTTFTTPLNLTLVVGGVTTTSISADSSGIFPDFTVNDRTSVVWKQAGSPFSTVLTTTDPVPGPKGDPGNSGAKGDKGDRGDLAAWQPTTFYPLNQVISDPLGNLVRVTTAHTSTASYDSTKFADAVPARLQDTALNAAYAPKSIEATVAAKADASAVAAKLDKADAVPKWKANTAYTAGQQVVSPNGDIVSAVATFTSGGAYSAANWTLSTTFAKPADVQPLVVTALAADNTPAQAAATAASTAVTNELATNPVLPRVGEPEGDNYLSYSVTKNGRLLHGVRRDGSVELPIARLGTSMVRDIDSEDYLKGTASPTGRVFEDVLGKDGRVPQWVLNAWASRMNISATPDPYDIVIVAGQSNATQAASLNVSSEDVDPRLFKWNSTTSAIEQVSAGDTWLGASFGREYLKGQPPGKRVLIVPTAVGATGFTSTSLASPPAGYHTVAGGTWDRTLTSDPINLYDQMIAKVNAARTAAGAGARVVAFLWSQGEEDTWSGGGLSQSAYATKLDDLITTAFTTLGITGTPVLIGSMTPDLRAGNTAGTTVPDVHLAHVDTPRRLTRAAFIDGPKDLGHYNDTIHWSAQGQRVRGKLFYDALYRAKLNDPSIKPLPPQNLRVSRSGSTVSVAWDFPPTRVTAFTIEYAVDGGAWTAAILAGPVITETTFTVAAASTVSVRGRSTNEIGTTTNTREVKA